VHGSEKEGLGEEPHQHEEQQQQDQQQRIHVSGVLASWWCLGSARDGSERDALREELRSLDEKAIAAAPPRERWRQFREERPWMERVWWFLEYPRSSRGAFWWAVGMNFLLIVFIIQIILESYASLSTKDSWALALFVLDTIVTAFFTVEFIARIATCPSHPAFVRTALNWIDLLSILPYYINLGVTSSAATGFQSLRALRLFRLLRLVKVGTLSRTVVVLAQAMANAAGGIALLAAILLLEMVVFGTLIFYMETSRCILDDNNEWVYKDSVGFPFAGQPTFYQNIPDSMWWTIVTVSTVGYGDAFPVVWPGRFVAIFTMITALATVAFPITLISNEFNSTMERLQQQERAAAREKRRLESLERRRSISSALRRGVSKATEPLSLTLKRAVRSVGLSTPKEATARGETPSANGDEGEAFSPIGQMMLKNHVNEPSTEATPRHEAVLTPSASPRAQPLRNPHVRSALTASSSKTSTRGSRQPIFVTSDDHAHQNGGSSSLQHGTTARHSPNPANASTRGASVVSNVWADLEIVQMEQQRLLAQLRAALEEVKSSTNDR